MRFLRAHSKKPKVSVIFLDWKVRESFHGLDYLDRQTVPRSEYEVLWIEFYDHVPAQLREKVEASEQLGRCLIEQWIVIGADPETYFHKHYAYNVGIALAQGEICVISDSDAMYPEDFIERIIREFSEHQDIVLHIDQVRNRNRAFYPFNYPDFWEVIRDPHTINWTGRTTKGLDNSPDILHEANYGACMAARRKDLIAIGGADEHVDYLGYICGPYDLTFRLMNHGRREIWLNDIFLVHTWHPSEGGSGNRGGPQDGRGMSLRALEALESGRVMPGVENPAIASCRLRATADRERLVQKLESVSFEDWTVDNSHLKRMDVPSLVRENIGPFNIVEFEGKYYAFPHSAGAFIADKARSGEYDIYDHDSDVDALIERHSRTIGQSAREHSSASPELIRSAVIGCNVVRYEGWYYAIAPSGGVFRPDKLSTGEYAALLRAQELDELMQQLKNRRWAEREAITSSSLFDADYYLQRNSDVAASGNDPLDHFLEHGAAEGRDPNSLFDTKYYARFCTEAMEAGENPLAHFIRVGVFEGIRPNWLFDPDYYYRKNMDVAAAGANALAHFLLAGVKEGRNPHPLFDTAFYLSANHRVAASGENPLVHYLNRGAADGPQPNILFSPRYYLEQCRDEDARFNPLRHFIEVGADLNLDPHPLFDTAFYRSKYSVPVEVNPLSHFLERGGTNSPTRYFDSNFYLRRYPDVAAAGMNPLLHFVNSGAAEGRWPNPFFNTSAYMARHPGLIESRVNPLAHFIASQSPSTERGSAPSKRVSTVSDRCPLTPMSVIVITAGNSTLLDSTLHAFRKCRRWREVEVLIVGEIDSRRTTGSELPVLRYIKTNTVDYPAARNRGAQEASYETLLFLEEGLEPISDEFFAVHSSLHALFQGTEFVVSGSVLDNDGVDWGWPSTQEGESGALDFRQFNAANVSLKKAAVADWASQGYSSQFKEGLDGIELAYRLSSSRLGLRLVQDPRAGVVRRWPLNVREWMHRHTASGRMLRLFLDLHPEAKSSFGLESLLNALSSSVDVGNKDDYDALLEGLREWLRLLCEQSESVSSTSQRQSMHALLEICRIQGFLSETGSRANVAAAQKELVGRFMQRFRQSLHADLLRRLAPTHAAGTAAASI